MNYQPSYYHSGEEIQPGDRIAYAGSSGKVLFVLGQTNLPADWSPPEAWLPEPTTAGFMIEVESMGLVFMRDADEDLELTGR